MDGDCALVVFCGQTDVWWLRFLKHGFRHCFVVVKLGERWVAIDPMLHHWDVSLPDIDAAFDLRTWLEDQGYRVIETQILTPERQYFPPLFLSCVEVVKRVIGMQNPLIITPYQLYRYFKFKH